MTFCPSCGFNLAKDEPIERDGFVLDPRGAATFQGHFLPLRPTHVAILHTIASQGDRISPAVLIADRIGSEATDPKGLMQVQICRMKRCLEAVGAPFPVSNVHGHGYRWGRA